MSANIDLSTVEPTSYLVGEDDDDTRMLRQMLHRAENFLLSFQWCPGITSSYFGGGVGGVVAVFLFELASKISGTNDDFLWIIEGDVPSAYLVTDDAPTPAAALGIYCGMMEEWANAVLTDASLDEVYPVPVPATKKNAIELLSRTRFIRERVIPHCGK